MTLQKHSWSVIPPDATLEECIIKDIIPEDIDHHKVDSTQAIQFKIELKRKNSRITYAIVLDRAEITELIKKYNVNTYKKLKEKHITGAYIHNMLYGLQPKSS